jgi:cell division protein FtsI/penicillin-binding protein 2
MRNRAVRDTYEPGSVFQIVAPSLAFENGFVRAETIFDCFQETMTNRAAR